MPSPPRRAVAAEIADVAALWLRSRKACFPAIPACVHDDDDVHRWFRETVATARDPWVIDGDDGLLAMMTLEPGWIDQLYVAPERTGQGLGVAMVEVAKREHPDGLLLWAFQSNVGARRFYEREGFVAVAFTDGDNEEGEPDVKYQWLP